MLLEIDGRAELYRGDERIGEAVDESVEVDVEAEADVDVASDGPVGVRLVASGAEESRLLEVDGVAELRVGESRERLVDAQTHVPPELDADLVSDGPVVVTLSEGSAVEERIL